MKTIESLNPKFRDAFTAPPHGEDNQHWLSETRQRAFERLQTLQFPTRKHEAWRYINLEPLLETHFSTFDHAPISPHVEQVAEKYLLPDPQVIRFTSMNGRFDARLSELSLLPPGSVIANLSKSFIDVPELVESCFPTSVSAIQNPFVALNTAYFKDGVFLFIPDDTVFEQPLQLTFIHTDTSDAQPVMDHPRLILHLGKRAKLDLIITQVGMATERSFQNTVVDISVGQEAELNAVLMQRSTSATLNFVSMNIQQEPRSLLHISTFTHGGHITRNDIQTHLQEEARASINGLALLTHASQLFEHVTAHHLAPKSFSRQLFKTILNGEARSEFNSLSHIHRGASLSDSGQLSRNMTLSPSARAIARPQLRVFNDDVKGAHGATVGQVSPEELFYLQSRGLSKEVAQSLLIYGFAEEVIESVASEMFRNHLETFVKQDLHEVVTHDSTSA